MNKPFEELNVHKKGVVLTRMIFDLLHHRYFENEGGFKDRLKIAVVSITNNVAKGAESNDNEQFVTYLKMAKENCAEVKNMLVLSRELNFCNKTEMKPSYELTVEIAESLSNFIKYLNNNIKD